MAVKHAVGRSFSTVETSAQAESSKLFVQPTTHCGVLLAEAVLNDGVEHLAHFAEIQPIERVPHVITDH